ncbi:hypothetical protein Sango_1346800 [Sesamum angolense]|uniref:WD repeat-containing protein 75 second beta-propeller domain-containing protein n=1 Tax=Sesamum angolense TaxID=2727404 RepID=A0AAE1WT12_9LAMI|nr:hypothetical protein Sango_1346800 [Sesamum angolense]
MITGGKSFVSSPPAFSNDAKRLLVCTGNTVSVFSTSTGLQISELEGHVAQVTSVIVVPVSSPASKLMCNCWTASLDGKIKYWDFAAPELMTTIDIGSPIHSMVIPSLLSQSTENNGKRPDLFAYIFTEDVKHKEEKTNCLCGQIQKCNLTKSRIVGGVTLAKISRADNQIQLLRMPSMEILRSISGIKPSSSHMEIYEGFGSGVVFNHTSGLLAVPTENYRVQFYNLFDDREISEVKVNLVALSPDGSTMSTVETRLPEEGIGSLVSLKFWACGSQNKHFSLSTVIYEPHGESGISSVAFRPTSHMAVSSSYGGDFKVWVRRHEISTEDETAENTGWRCHAVGSYKKKPMTAAAFSGDGSVLAVAAEKVITLWDPDRNALLAVIGDSLEPITTLSFVGKSEYLVSASRGSDPQLTIWSMSKLSVACSVDKSTFAVLALIKPAKHMEPTEASLHSAEGVILLFNVENPVPLSTWFVSKAQSGRLSFVWSSPKSEDDVAETKSFDEVLAYINGAHEYVLLSPYGEQASNLSFSHQRNFSSLEEKERFGYASIYGELPDFSLKIDQTPFPSMPSEKTWKTIFSGPSHSLPPLPKLCSDFLESLLERRSALVE